MWENGGMYSVVIRASYARSQRSILLVDKPSISASQNRLPQIETGIEKKLVYKQ